MKYLQNLHTHTTYCDGKNTAEEMVQKAIELGFHSLGFSGHAPMPDSIPAAYAMTKEDVPKYVAEVEGLKEKYADKLEIFTGIEFDALSELDLTDFDYVIGSVHYIRKGDIVVDFDISADGVKKIIDEIYGGNGMQFAREYYEELARLPESVTPDFVGHFDIVAKHCEKIPFFDIESKEYKNYALEALHALAPKCRFYEVNVGGIPRGYRLSPYPPKFILKEMRELGCGLVITSDCHNKDYLNTGFDEAVDLIRDCDFNEVYEFTSEGFKGMKIE